MPYCHTLLYQSYSYMLSYNEHVIYSSQFIFYSCICNCSFSLLSYSYALSHKVLVAIISMKWITDHIGRILVSINLQDIKRYQNCRISKDIKTVGYSSVSVCRISVDIGLQDTRRYRSVGHPSMSINTWDIRRYRSVGNQLQNPSKHAYLST